jgi:hypothetical protein
VDLEENSSKKGVYMRNATDGNHERQLLQEIASLSFTETLKMLSVSGKVLWCGTKSNMGSQQRALIEQCRTERNAGIDEMLQQCSFGVNT